MGNPNTNTNYRKKKTPSSAGGGEEDLHRAARTGDINAVQSIIASNPLTVNYRDKHPRTPFCRSPLHIAVMSGDTEFATKILSKKPDLALKEDAQGSTPLHYASVRTNLEMVKLLLRAGTTDACIVQDADGRTPLHLAATKDPVEIIKLLMEERPQAIHLKNDHNGETILHFCVKSHSNLKTLEILVNSLVLAPLREQNPNPISNNSRNETPSYWSY